MYKFIYKFILVEIISREIEREREREPPPLSITHIYSLYKQERDVNREGVCVCVCVMYVYLRYTRIKMISRERGRVR